MTLTHTPMILTEPAILSQVNAPDMPLSGVKRPLKIMLLYQDFAVMGGIERYLLQTAQLLAEDAAFQPVVACTEGGPLYRQMQALGVPVHGLPYRPFFAKSFLRTLDVSSLRAMARLIQSEKPDIVHVHMGLHENIWLKKLGVPMVYTFHGYGTLFSMAGITNPLKQLFKSWSRGWFQQTAQAMDAMLVVSETERQRLLDEGYLPADTQAQVLHNGMDTDAWEYKVRQADRPALRQQWGIPTGIPCVAYFNRLDFNKCPLDFVTLAQLMTSEAQTAGVPSPHFLMAGDGPMQAEVREAIQGLPNFSYIGLCEDIPGLLAVADLVIHPACREGFGLGVVEAMTAGVPVIAYDCGGPQEILNTPETRHLLAPVYDVASLARKAQEILSYSVSQREALAQALRRRAEDFSIDRFKSSLTHVYRQLAPSVSIILPVFNGRDTILRAVNSVLAQTHQNLELIVVDDGSTDDTLALLSTIQDDRLRVLSQQNQGVATARNLAFAHAHGAWIGFIDADDVWLPEKLAVEFQTVRNNSSDSQLACLVYSGYYAVNDQDELIHQPPVNVLNGDLSQAVLEHEGLFLPSTSLVHRQIFEAVGGFKSGCYHEDRVFFIEACRQFPAFCTEKRLVLYRQSLSGRCRSVLKNYDQALDAELSIVETLRSILSPSELLRLAGLQQRNLLYRFLMYNYLDHARRLHREIQSQAQPRSQSISLFQGNKGRLAKLSLGLGVNFMFAARLFIQGLTQKFISPRWSRQMSTRLVSGSPTSPNPLNR